ncbi:class I SAM-dependent methyltransferase [Microscilla marina]|uniref:Putative S-adenosyl-L-methionine (SAM)-MTase n=1 Tax=Microscilla marina ATCC 23134 TaxID=313606 RepID=A1ZJM1_MICM2|nr:class I SAM-dependent methyltransferase [Microscilla marina]EAY29324.1 putative S-adenosyl-L-methionine (SAM)-MTase [Microscilla marina ATCC 23134]
MKSNIAQELKDSYDAQYKDPHIKKWRELGAKNKVQNIINITQGHSFDRVLEVGSGDGSILQELSRQNFAQELYSVEISQSGLEAIQARNIPQLKSVQLFDGYKVPFEDHSFDLVILTHVLEHVEFERLLLRELKRLAKHQVIEVPKDYRFGVDKKLKHFLAYGHINMYTPSSLRFLVKSEGFRILKNNTAIYSKDVYTFNKPSFTQKLKAQMVYLAKQALTHTPSVAFNHRYIDTITLFTESSDQGLDIM